MAPLDWKRVQTFMFTHFLPLGLIFVTLFGLVAPAPGQWIDRTTPLNTISIVGIFFISGLQLQTAEVTAALKAWPAFLFSLVSILALSPCLSLLISKLDLGPREFSDGLALFMAMPTTVSSGVLMTTEAGGNTALAILLSAGTNLVGVGTAPLFLSLFLGRGGERGGTSPPPGGRAFDILDLLVKLSCAILLPLLLGKGLRQSKRVTEWVKAQKVLLKVVSTCLLLSVPWMAISSGADLIKAAPIGTVLALVGLGVTLHALLLAFNYGACWVMRRVGLPINTAETKAAVISSSQKTVNTAVSVINFLPLALGDKGLLTLPCVLAHLMQIIMDAFIVTRWKAYNDDTDGGGGQPPRTGAAPAHDAVVQGVGHSVGAVRVLEGELSGRSGGLASQDASGSSSHVELTGRGGGAGAGALPAGGGVESFSGGTIHDRGAAVGKGVTTPHAAAAVRPPALVDDW